MINSFSKIIDHLRVKTFGSANINSLTTSKFFSYRAKPCLQCGTLTNVHHPAFVYIFEMLVKSTICVTITNLKSLSIDWIT